jgi:hypothetical protein
MESSRANTTTFLLLNLPLQKIFSFEENIFHIYLAGCGIQHDGVFYSFSVTGF